MLDQIRIINLAFVDRPFPSSGYGSWIHAPSHPSTPGNDSQLGLGEE